MGGHAETQGGACGGGGDDLGHGTGGTMTRHRKNSVLSVKCGGEGVGEVGGEGVEEVGGEGMGRWVVRDGEVSGEGMGRWVVREWGRWVVRDGEVGGERVGRWVVRGWERRVVREWGSE